MRIKGTSTPVRIEDLSVGAPLALTLTARIEEVNRRGNVVKFRLRATHDSVYLSAQDDVEIEFLPAVPAEPTQPEYETGAVYRNKERDTLWFRTFRGWQRLMMAGRVGAEIADWDVDQTSIGTMEKIS